MQDCYDKMLLFPRHLLTSIHPDDCAAEPGNEKPTYTGLHKQHAGKHAWLPSSKAQDSSMQLLPNAIEAIETGTPGKGLRCFRVR
jgi:hypothetical protein